jgi:VWFA-related protein
MAHLPGFGRNQRKILVWMAAWFWACGAGYAQTPATSDPATQAGQSSPAKSDAPNSSTQTQATKGAAQTPARNGAPPAEVTSQDTGTTFKVRVNLVMVRVVVRDAKGQIVSNLNKEDFQLFDNKKPQTITTFNVETPASHVMKAPSAASGADVSADAVGNRVINVPQRFVAMVFDDVHLGMEDATFVRTSATKFLASTAATDRVAIFSTSGQFNEDFTDDREILNRKLLSVVPRPQAMGGSGIRDCPDMDYYQADLIQNKNDAQAIGVATEDAVQCAFNGDERQQAAAQAMAISEAQHILTAGDADAEYAYRNVETALRRLTGMPGQRVMVFISPGFIQSSYFPGGSELVERAMRANVVINTIDARGLYTPDLGGDIANPTRDPPAIAGYKATYQQDEQLAQADILAQLADGTGGTYFHNRNDIAEGMIEAGAAPAFSYVLGFSPQNLKIDGKYHYLKVSLTGKQKYALQARHGYFAPRTIADPAEAAKQEIQEAIFSQDEIRDLPMDLQTQFFKKDAAEAKLAVLTHFDVKGIRFRKAEGRNLDDLTIATAIFDENGNLVAGGEKLLTMKLLDTTYERMSKSGFTVKSSFDVKPGTYLVRQVVRDAEGAQMAARNGAIVIPD